MDPKMVCPYICPSTQKEPPTEYPEAGTLRGKDAEFKRHYQPGFIAPPVPYVYAKDAAPKYLPQLSDTISGDILTMGPTGPWAPGHVDWSPQAGMTGVRPVVEKYSITRYSTGQWRKNNQKILDAVPDKLARKCHTDNVQFIKTMYDVTKNANDASNTKLKERIKELRDCTIKVERAVQGITDEIEALEKDRSILKKASRILMYPETIAKECLELRTHRLEPDLVRDDAEMELIIEVSLVGEIRRIFNETLMKVEAQMAENRAAKSVIESDWSDKFVTLKLDSYNLKLDGSNLVLRHPGVKRWPENMCTLDYWKHFCNESVRNCEDIRKKSENLRADLKTSIVKGGQDIKTQSDRVNNALREVVDSTEQLCNQLEETLRTNLQTIADLEIMIEDLQEALRVLRTKDKTMMTRIHARNYDRPNVENCKDEAQYALMGEGKLLQEKIDEVIQKIRETETAKAEAVMFRGKLEKDIACKRKALNIDRDRLSRIRAHLPKPEEFANIAGDNN